MSLISQLVKKREREREKERAMKVNIAVAVPAVGIVYGARLYHEGHIVAGMSLCVISLYAWVYVQ